MMIWSRRSDTLITFDHLFIDAFVWLRKKVDACLKVLEIEFNGMRMIRDRQYYFTENIN